jgi:hypothetical protein
VIDRDVEDHDMADRDIADCDVADRDMADRDKADRDTTDRDIADRGGGEKRTYATRVANGSLWGKSPVRTCSPTKGTSLVAKILLGFMDGEPIVTMHALFILYVARRLSL